MSTSMDARTVSRRTLLGGAAAAALPAGGTTTAWADGRGRRAPRVLVATNEPWGTYHVRPLLPELARRSGWRVTQLVPDYAGIADGETVSVAVPGDAGPADLLVVTGAGDWPAECAARFPRLPLVASSLAYQQPVEAPGAAGLRRRLRLVTSSSPAEGRAFVRYLGVRRPARVVGSPQTDDLPVRRPEPGLVLVLTSAPGAPGSDLLLASAERLAAAGRRILVGLHPREDRSRWDRWEIADVPSVTASARAEVAIGIPGTVFPLVTAVGTPVVGCLDPALAVPEYLLDVCSSVIDDPAAAVGAVAGARLPDAATLADAVGPVGGSAARLLDAWRVHARTGARAGQGA
jgi:hypothetical protein